MGRPSKRVKPAFSKNVSARLKSLAWTGHKLATEARLPYPTVRDIVAGISPGLQENREAIAKAIGASLAELEDKSIPAIRPHPEVAWAESARVLHALSRASDERRLSVLYLLLKDDNYLELLEKLPDCAQFARALKKVP